MREINLYLVIIAMGVIVIHVFTLRKGVLKDTKISELKTMVREKHIEISEIKRQLWFARIGMENSDTIIDKLKIKIELLEQSETPLLREKVADWFVSRNLHNGDPKKQVLKLVEEVGELVGALIRDDKDEIIDALGDIQVVMIGLGMQLELNLNDCLLSAYSEIENRKGKTVNGIFVKEEDVK